MERCCTCFRSQSDKSQHKNEEERVKVLEKELADMKIILTKLENSLKQKIKRDKNHQLTDFELAW
jgi:protein subunit release factor A